VSDSPKATTVPNTISLDAQIGQAWDYHYKRQNEQALPLFQALVEQNPSHIDANYGLALVLATLHQNARAMEVFKYTAELVQTRMTQQAADDEDSRYRMLARMIDQQLEVLTRGT